MAYKKIINHEDAALHKGQEKVRVKGKVYLNMIKSHCSIHAFTSLLNAGFFCIWNMAYKKIINHKRRSAT